MAEDEEKIVDELDAVQGSPVEIGGYYRPDPERVGGGDAAERDAERGAERVREPPRRDMSAGGAFDLDAYLERIGASTASGIREIHRAHALAIPFENLDPRRGVPVSLELDDLQRKLVAPASGGYCFEQNLLLAAALESLGAEVELMLARVRRARPGRGATAYAPRAAGARRTGPGTPTPASAAAIR